jgi:hypothetical protein
MDQKSARSARQALRPEAHADSHGIAWAPPAYGIEAADHQPAQAGLEALSAMALDDVGAHLNLAPGQERHLPYEGLHVVQRMEQPAPSRAAGTLYFSPGPYNDVTELPAWMKHGHTEEEIEAAVAAGWATRVAYGPPDHKIYIEWAGDKAGIILRPHHVDGCWRVTHALSGAKKAAAKAAAPSVGRNWDSFGAKRK